MSSYTDLECMTCGIVQAHTGPHHDGAFVCCECQTERSAPAKPASQRKPTRKSLLTTGNPKTMKGEAAGYFTAVLHLAPATEAGMGTVCPRATAGCMAACLNTAGRGGIFKPGATSNAIQDARKRRTVFLKLDPWGFRNALHADIAAHVRRARAMGLRPAIRINGTSDLPGLAHDMAAAFPDVQFYDYTKVPTWLMTAHPSNLHRTFSRSERNAYECEMAMAAGMNVAVVFSTRKGQALPTMWHGRAVIDGDAHDLRFLDPRGVIVGLRAKGRARKDRSGFVVAA